MTANPQTTEERVKESPSSQLSKEILFGDQIRFFTQAGFDGEKLQRKINDARCLVIGGGLIGSHTMVLLADSGVGILKVLAGNTLEERDIAGNALLRPDDIGLICSEALKARLQRRSQYLAVESLTFDTLNKNELKSVLREVGCALICLDSPAPALLDAFNETALQTKTQWLSGQINRGVGLVGPTVIPDQSPCYKCYELRRNANLTNYDEVMQYESHLRQMPKIITDCNTARPVAALTASFLALEALRILSGVCLPQLAAKFLQINFWSSDITPHHILRLPNCTACGYGKRRELPQLKQLPQR